MYRRRHRDRIVRGGRLSSRNSGRAGGFFSKRQFSVERVEDRCLLSVTVPALHSDAGASMTIYLDFDGHNVRSTPWNVNGFGNFVSLPFDTDGNLGSYSQTELDTIQSV